MKRSVNIINTSSSDIAFGSLDVPSDGRLVVSFDKYIDVASEMYSIDSRLDIDSGGAGISDVSVTDFGAIGDGATDDTYAFQSAIDYVEGNGGGLVRVPAGIYSVDCIRILGNIELKGASVRNSIIRSSSSDGHAVLSIEGADAIVSGIRFVCR